MSQLGTKIGCQITVRNGKENQALEWWFLDGCSHVGRSKEGPTGEKSAEHVNLGTPAADSCFISNCHLLLYDWGNFLSTVSLSNKRRTNFEINLHLSPRIPSRQGSIEVGGQRREIYKSSMITELAKSVNLQLRQWMHNGCISASIHQHIQHFIPFLDW